jgi:hypothetical protein
MKPELQRVLANDWQVGRITQSQTTCKSAIANGLQKPKCKPLAKAKRWRYILFVANAFHFLFDKIALRFLFIALSFDFSLDSLQNSANLEP